MWASIMTSRTRKYWEKRVFKVVRLYPQKLVLTRSMIVYSHQSNKMKKRCEFANNKSKLRLCLLLIQIKACLLLIRFKRCLSSSFLSRISWHIKFGKTCRRDIDEAETRYTTERLVLYRFGVSPSTVSRVFSMWKGALDIRLWPLVSWSDLEDLWRTIPPDAQL